MNKKIGSIVLLCLTILSFLLLVLLWVDTGISIYQLKNTSLDSSEDISTGAFIIGYVVADLAILGGCLLFSFILSSVGFFSSLFNTKIATNPHTVKASTAFLYFYSVVLIFVIGVFIYSVISIF